MPFGANEARYLERDAKLVPLCAAAQWNDDLHHAVHALADEPQERTALACLLVSPHIPKLFMGEEFAASTPFLFFCDFGPELAQAVTEGRRREFARFASFSDAQARARIPDPGSAETFEASKLRWSEREQPTHHRRLELTRTLLALRHRHIAPRLRGALGGARLEIVNGVLRVEWQLGDGAREAAGGNLALTPGAVHAQIQPADA